MRILLLVVVLNSRRSKDKVTCSGFFEINESFQFLSCLFADRVSASWFARTPTYATQLPLYGGHWHGTIHNALSRAYKSSQIGFFFTEIELRVENNSVDTM